MNQFESNFIQDSLTSGVLLAAGLVWVVLAAVQGAPMADHDALMAQSRATSLHAKTSAPSAQPLLARAASVS